MQVTTGAIKRFLEYPQFIQGASSNIRDKVLALESQVTKTTTHITGMPNGSGSDRNMLLSNWIDTKDKWEHWKKMVVPARTNIIIMLESVDLTKEQKDLLEYRYLDNYSWKETLEKLSDLYDISERQMYREHNKALTTLKEWAEINEPDYIREFIL